MYCLMTWPRSSWGQMITSQSTSAKIILEHTDPVDLELDEEPIDRPEQLMRQSTQPFTYLTTDCWVDRTRYSRVRYASCLTSNHSYDMSYALSYLFIASESMRDHRSIFETSWFSRVISADFRSAACRAERKDSGLYGVKRGWRLLFLQVT